MQREVQFVLVESHEPYKKGTDHVPVGGTRQDDV